MDIRLNINRYIGENYPCYILMDIGANHNGDFKTAKQLIETAAEMGADGIKFQTYSAKKLYSTKTPKFSKDSTVPYEVIKKYQHPREWLPKLNEIAIKHKIDFISSPFDYEAVDILEEINVPYYKIASPEIVDLDLIEYIAKKQKPIIISTGMATIGEIEEAIEVVLKHDNNNIILLHCVVLYPCPVEFINLKAIETLRNVFKYPVGFSDHSLGIHISLAAISMGAKVIEKHFTLDKSQKGPDHHFALEPNELKEMVEKIRDIEKSMGDGIKKPNKLELEENYKLARRSIIAAMDISKGVKITRDMLIIKRPGFGIKPKFLNILLGKTAKVDIKKEQWITWDMI
ncbi:MAG: N-acetylneuraminate synthase family protein [Promethearchaeota archaeon]